MLPNRKEPKTHPGSEGQKDIISGLSSASGREDDIYAKVFHKDGTEVDLTKNSLPSGGKYEKVNIITSIKEVMSCSFVSLFDKLEGLHNNYRTIFFAHFCGRVGHD